MTLGTCPISPRIWWMAGKSRSAATTCVAAARTTAAASAAVSPLPVVNEILFLIELRETLTQINNEETEQKESSNGQNTSHPSTTCVLSCATWPALDQVVSLPGNEEASADVVDAILEEAAKFAGEVLSPLNRVERPTAPNGRTRS